MYWTVQIDVKYTLTGEGGGFSMFSPMSKVYEDTVPYYISHADGKPKWETAPSLKLPEPEINVAEDADEETIERAKEAAVEKRKAAMAKVSSEWHRITIRGGYDDRFQIYIDGQLEMERYRYMPSPHNTFEK